MAFRYLIYSTGTTYAGTIIRESLLSGTTAGEARYYTDFMIPEIQPLYLWRVNNVVTPTTVIPNSDANIYAYETAIAPPVTPDDLVNYGELTGITSTKIDKVTGATSNIPTFTAGGGLQDSGYTIPELTGLTTYTFVESGGTTILKNGNQITIYSTVPTGTTVSWGSIVGNISSQNDLWGNLSWLSGETATKLDISTFTGYTATTGQGINSKLAISVFTGYTATTAPVISGALTGATYAGTGTTLISSVGSRVVNLKSISTRGGVKLTGDGNNIIISGQTNTPSTWGTITGTLSAQTDLWNTLTGITGTSATKLDTSTFQSYTGATQILINSKVAKVTGATTNDIVIFGAGGAVADSGKQFINSVQGTGVATNNSIPTELAVRSAINSAIAAAVILQGDWNATTNVPNLTGGSITTGYAWRVSASGNTSLSGITGWQVGDLAVKSATGWIRINNQDISAIWGNIQGTLANQTDLQAALNAKLNTTTFSGYTGTTKLSIDSKLAITTFSGYTGSTKILIDSKLATSVFTGYTASTKNTNKKIQVVWTGGTQNANVVIPYEVVWKSASPYATDVYTWSGTSGIFIKSAGTYELQYHVVVKNDAANQTHSVGAYVLKNGVTQVITAGAGMVVGVSASGEISVPPVVITLAANDRLDLAVFRTGASGNANLVTGSVYLVLNKLT